MLGHRQLFPCQMLEAHYAAEQSEQIIRYDMTDMNLHISLNTSTDNPEYGYDFITKV